MYLYRQSILKGTQMNFILVEQEEQAAKDFLEKALRSNHVSKPRVFTVGKNPAYPNVIEQLKKCYANPTAEVLK